MLEALGDDYIIQHCLAEAEREKRDDLFRMYVADSLHYLGQGKSVGKPYSELIAEIDNPAKEERTDAEIRKSIKDGFNKLIGKGGKTEDGFNESGGNDSP